MSHISGLKSKKMEFEEFFKKKRIDLSALKQVQASLFSEFETHFAQMGEKSFDHTKKYWFNKLRREFPLAVEPKLEKVKIDNPLAEQTITESLIEQTAPSPKLGFTPKFRAASIPKTATETPAEDKTVGETLATPAPKLGFTPKFRAASPPKAAEDVPTEDKLTEPVATPAPKLGFTPKFKSSVASKPVTDEVPIEEKPTEQLSPTPKLGFTPKFKAANTPKPAADTPTEKTQEENAAQSPVEDTVAKPTYKPRFNMKNLPKKEEE
jgi:hypothetical protein